MQLNKEAEVSLHGQAADVEWTLERIADNKWWLKIKAAVAICYECHNTHWDEKLIVLTNDQASAVIALFIGEVSSKSLNAALYEIAEPAMKGLTQEFRIIP